MIDLILQLLSFLAFMFLMGFTLFVGMGITIMIIALIDYVFRFVRRSK